jgi:hypothetical protein
MKLEPKFFSIILIGRLNPQILNHDFLLKNNIIPLEKSPFKDIVIGKPEQNAFEDYVSTPVLSRLRYKNIDIVIEESRYQITDIGHISPSESSIIDFTKNYFLLLKHTPLSFGGINFNSHLIFDSDKEKASFEDKFISNRDGFYKNLGINNFDVSIKLDFVLPGPQNKVELSFNKLRASPLVKMINFNYGFSFTIGMEAFLKNLDDVSNLFQKYGEILTKLGVK